MIENKPMNIRKFTLLGCISLAILIISKIIGVMHLDDEVLRIINVILIVIGNITFGVSLVGYFLHLKDRENIYIKVTSLVIGVLFISNFFAINDFIKLFGDVNYNVFDYVDKRIWIGYNTVVSLLFIVFAYSFLKLGKVNRLISFLSLFFITTSTCFLVTNIFNSFLQSLLIEYVSIDNGILDGFKHFEHIIDLVSYLLLFGIYISLYLSQKSLYVKAFKVKIND